MSKNRSALYIGRFQPYHVGHQMCIQEIVNDGFEDIVIGIGSVNKKDERNPYNYKERVDLIHEANFMLGAVIDFIPLVDMGSDGDWVEYVLGKCKLYLDITSPILYTNSKFGEKCLKKVFNQFAPHIEVREFKWPSKIPFDLSATKIRNDLEEYKAFLHPSVYNKIKISQGVLEHAS